MVVRESIYGEPPTLQAALATSFLLYHIALLGYLGIISAHCLIRARVTESRNLSETFKRQIYEAYSGNRKYHTVSSNLRVELIRNLPDHQFQLTLTFNVFVVDTVESGPCH